MSDTPANTVQTATATTAPAVAVVPEQRLPQLNPLARKLLPTHKPTPVKNQKLMASSAKLILRTAQALFSSEAKLRNK